MTEKDKRWKEDEFELDITDTGKKRKTKKLGEDTEIEEFLKGTIEGMSGERRTVHIPQHVLARLPPAKNTWEAIQEFVIERSVEKIIKKVIWDINQALLREPEPEIIAPDTPLFYEKQDLSQGYLIRQDGEIEDLRRSDRDTVTIGIERLKEVYLMLHDEVILRAQEVHEPRRVSELYKTIEDLQNSQSKSELEKKENEILAQRSKIQELTKQIEAQEDHLAAKNLVIENMKRDEERAKEETKKLKFMISDLEDGLSKRQLKRWQEYKEQKYQKNLMDHL